jgi:hypothetical protein
VLTDELAAIAFTEEELVWQANQQLPNHERISYRTYQRYKADILYMEEEGLPDNNEELVPMPYDDGDDDADLVRQMYVCLKDALMKQKLALVRGVYEAKPNWRRYTWMLERKFPDFRLKLPAAINGTSLADKKLDTPRGEGRKDKIAPETEAEKKLRIEAYFAKKAAEKALIKPLSVEQKWEGRYHQPWKPMFFGNEGYFKLDIIKELEEEMERDVAAGYINPYAHLEYRREPLPDGETGFYKLFGMGDGKLPLLVHMLRDSDSPKREEYQELWEKQEHKRKNMIRAEQGLPPEALPSELEENRHSLRWSGSILGHSGG